MRDSNQHLQFILHIDLINVASPTPTTLMRCEETTNTGMLAVNHCQGYPSVSFAKSPALHQPRNLGQ